MSEPYPCFRPVADHALLVEFGAAISDETHREVLRLDQALARTPFPGFVEAVPAYVNLLVAFDPQISDHRSVRAAVEALLTMAPAPVPASEVREVQVCYDADFAPDLGQVAARAGLSEEAVVAAHIGGDYAVYMYGFAPGYAYLSGVPEAIRLPRKPAPVRDVPAGSVLIAGAQCLVTTLVMPTGWWIIGRSPTKILASDEEHPFLFGVGDRVTFRRIGRAELLTDAP